MDYSFIPPKQTCQRFTLAEIQSATNNFDEALVIGRGGFGKVYKCARKIGELSEVAFKRLNPTSNQGTREFGTEVEVLSTLRHGNLVSLIGYCNEGNEMILAYEFMPNGTLEDHLHKGDTDLSWLQRLKICLGAARGLDYLHTGTSTQHGVIHRDVKTSNILLDANFAAKISDFGLAKVGPINQTHTFVRTGVKGTFGYMDPSYFLSGKLTRKSDVYAFGVVLFEVLSGKQALDTTFDEDEYLAGWAQKQIKDGKLNQIIAPRLIGQISKRSLKEFTSIAGQCLDSQPKQRPTMAEIVVKLDSILSQDSNTTNSVGDEGRFINRVRNFFNVKNGLMPTHTVGNYEISPDHRMEQSNNKTEVMLTHTMGSYEIRPDHHIEQSNNCSVGTFSYAALVSATDNFKHGEYSTALTETIYKGWVDERTYAPTECDVRLAVYVRKRQIGTLKFELKPEEFDYPNLVKILGYCLNEQEFLCVYKLSPGTSLDKLLYGEPHITSLSWVARLTIALGAAQGLSFLHQRNHPAYSQFKTAHILVDLDYNARLSNFEVEKSLAKLGPYSFEIDAFYAAPEWLKYKKGYTGVSDYECGFGVKSEVYAFGVVLLEILTGMKVFDDNRPKKKQNLVEWATPLLTDEVNLGMIMDPQLQDNNHPPNGAFELALLILKCLQPSQENRPSMEEIFQVLYMGYQEESKIAEIKELEM